VQHRFILINFLLFSAAVQFCKGRYTNTSLWLWSFIVSKQNHVTPYCTTHTTNYRLGQKKLHRVQCTIILHPSAVESHGFHQNA